MTDMALDVSQGNESPTAPPAEVKSSSASSPSTTPVERTFTQADVNDIVGKVKHEAIERYKSREQATQTPTSPVDESNIRKLAAEEAQRLRDEWVQDAQRSAYEQDAQRIANEFYTKLNAGKSKYSDFDTVMGDVDFKTIPHIVQLANMVDNTSDVIYDLAKNPSKIGIIQQLIQVSPQLAFKEINRLSAAIKDNESASNMKVPNAPLTQMKPSNTGTDNGAMTVSDYRRKYRA